MQKVKKTLSSDYSYSIMISVMKCPMSLASLRYVEYADDAIWRTDKGSNLNTGNPQNITDVAQSYCIK